MAPSLRVPGAVERSAWNKSSGSAPASRRTKALTVRTFLRKRRSSHASSCKESKRPRIASSEYSSLRSCEREAVCLLRSGKRKRVPLYGETMSQPHSRYGANWSGNCSKKDSPANLILSPGLFAVAPGRNWAAGSKKTRCEPLIKDGTSVKWYTALKPSPNRPVAFPAASFAFDPMLQMLRRSRGVNWALLKTQRAGPCHSRIEGERSDWSPCWAWSKMKETSVAPASSLFWMSSCRMPTPSAYSSRMLWSLLVRDSYCPNASTFSWPRAKVSAFRPRSHKRSDCAPSRAAISCAMLGCTRRRLLAELRIEAAWPPAACCPPARLSLSHGVSSKSSSCATTIAHAVSGR